MKKMNIDFEKFMAHKKMLDNQCYIDGNYLVLNVRYEYDIALSRISTHDAILDWVLHLSRKNWVTLELIQRFISLAKMQLKNTKA